ncbi:hypothetical protein Dimus_008277, partial [Dionaea muscipula]
MRSAGAHIHLQPSSASSEIALSLELDRGNSAMPGSRHTRSSGHGRSAMRGDEVRPRAACRLPPDARPRECSYALPHAERLARLHRLCSAYMNRGEELDLLWWRRSSAFLHARAIARLALRSPSSASSCTGRAKIGHPRLSSYARLKETPNEPGPAEALDRAR